MVCLPMVLIGASSCTCGAVERDAVGLERDDDVTHRDRAEQLAGFGRLTDHDDVLALDLLGDLGRLALGLEVASLEIGLHAVVLGAVVGGGAQRLAALEQEIAGIAVANLHDFAHLAELAHAFQQNDFHIRSPLKCLSCSVFGLNLRCRQWRRLPVAQEALAEAEHGVRKAEDRPAR